MCTKLSNLVFHEPRLVEGDTKFYHEVVFCNLVRNTGCAFEPLKTYVQHGFVAKAPF